MKVDSVGVCRGDEHVHPEVKLFLPDKKGFLNMSLEQIFLPLDLSFNLVFFLQYLPLVLLQVTNKLEVLSYSGIELFSHPIITLILNLLSEKPILLLTKSILPQIQNV